MAEEIMVQRASTSEELIKKGTTIFPKDDTGLFLWDYQARGYFKESLAGLIELGIVDAVAGLSKWTVKRAVDTFVFIRQRRAYYKDADMKVIKESTVTRQRTLRGTTQQGERICLASSQELPIGTNVEFDIDILAGFNPKSKMLIGPDAIIAALEYGSLKGLGQWRSGGWGRFSFEILEQSSPEKPKKSKKDEEAETPAEEASTKKGVKLTGKAPELAAAGK